MGMGGCGRCGSPTPMSSPDTRATALAATVNVVTWTQISRWVTGRGWPGGAAAIVAMLAAESAGSLGALPPLARAAAGVLTTPGNVALQAAGVVPPQTGSGSHR